MIGSREKGNQNQRMGNCISRDETEISGKDGHKANGHIGRGKNEQNIKKDSFHSILQPACS